MKVLSVNSVFRRGSTGKIVGDHHTELQKRGIESIVCYANGDEYNEPNVYRISSPFEQKMQALRARLTGLMYGGCRKQTKRIISVIKKENPDIVHLHCINGYTANIFKLLSWLKINEIKTVLTQHAEFFYTGSCGYSYDCEKWRSGCGNCPNLKTEVPTWFFDRTQMSWKKMSQAFGGFHNLIVTSVSPWLMDRAKLSPFLADKRHVVVYNGLDIDSFNKKGVTALRNQYGLTNEKIIFYATSNFSCDPLHRKGGYYVLKVAEALKEQNVRVFVAGSHAEDLSVPENVTLLGKIEDKEMLAQYYSLADVTLLTSKKETFSMICAESLCCGTPVVGFKAGAPERIAISEYSRFVEFGNLDELIKEIKSCLENKILVDEKVSQNTYSCENMTTNYCSVYDALLSSNDGR